MSQDVRFMIWAALACFFGLMFILSLHSQNYTAATAMAFSTACEVAAMVANRFGV